MNAIEKYTDMLQSQNDILLFWFVFIFIVCIIELCFVVKFGDHNNELIAENKKLKKENDGLKEDLIKSKRLSNVDIEKLEREIYVLKKQLDFALTTDPMFKNSEQIGEYRVSKRGVHISTYFDTAVYFFRKFCAGKKNLVLPKTCYKYTLWNPDKLRDKDKIMLEHELVEYKTAYENQNQKSVKTKKSNKNGKNSSKKTGKKA